MVTCSIKWCGNSKKNSNFKTNGITFHRCSDSVQVHGSMERLQESCILKFNPDTLDYLRKLYNLNGPGQMDGAIDILDAWIKKQNHFVRKEFPREYLERVIIQQKGSVERAKAQMDKICSLRTLLPQYFDKCDAKSNFKVIDGYMSLSFLPRLTKDHIRIVLAKYEPKKYSAKIFFYSYVQIAMVCEYFKARDYFNGVIIVSDLRGINIMDFVAQMNLTEMKEICTIFLEGYDTRVQKFIFLSSSKTIDVLVKIFKQMISEKLAQRIHVLKTNEDLHQHVPIELLPSDYGGDEQPLPVLADNLLNELSSKEFMSYLKEMSKVQTIEALRIPSEYNGDFSGLAGTFRSLTFD